MTVVSHQESSRLVACVFNSIFQLGLDTSRFNLSTWFGTPADSVFQVGLDTSRFNLCLGHQPIQSFNLGWTLADLICVFSRAMAREWKNCANNVNSLTVQLEHQLLRQLDSNCVDNVNSQRRLDNHPGDVKRYVGSAEKMASWQTS